MPELPEVETTRRGLQPALAGKRIEHVAVRNAKLRQPIAAAFAQCVAGAVVTGLERRAKYILARLSTGHTIVLHLGMSGSLTVTAGGAQPGARRAKSAANGGAVAYAKHDHVVFTLADAVITYNDPRRFGLMLLVPTAEVETHPLFKTLGPEPLGDSFTGEVLRRSLKGKSTALKVAIMDQRVVVGVGNIYASEALFRARLNPKMAAGKLTARQAEILVSSIKQVLAEAIEAGGSSLRDYKHGDGQLGYFQHSFKVYNQKGKPCPVCGAAIAHAVLGQRSTYWCPTCQK